MSSVPYSLAFFYGFKKISGPTLRYVKKLPLPVTMAVGMIAPVAACATYFIGLHSILGINMTKLREESEAEEIDAETLKNDMVSFIGMAEDVVNSAPDLAKVQDDITKTF